jgi:hypothetical protein
MDHHHYARLTPRGRDQRTTLRNGKCFAGQIILAQHCQSGVDVIPKRSCLATVNVGYRRR